MDFLQFARAKGLLMETLPPIGVWKRYATEDHPSKRNGSAKYMGTHGFVVNHAMDTSADTWRPDSSYVMDAAKQAELARQAREAELRTQELNREAAQKAAWILKQSRFGRHKYLINKGFPDEEGNVWNQDGRSLLIIPMRLGARLVGCQMIDEQGQKKFLFGQRTSNASFVFDNKGPNILCEGYATALSVRAALRAMKRRYTIHVCFSASNMIKVAAGLPSGLVIADNDSSATGERAAKQIGWPYWMSSVIGNDANDDMQAQGIYKFSQGLVRSLNLLVCHNERLNGQN